MPKTKISEFSATPGNNTDIDGINIAEGCAPSGINDAIRELMAQLKDFQAGTAGDSFNGPVGTSTAAAGAFTTLTTSSTVTHNGGTANGVAYLNGSKVLTTGSALTFDGTNFASTGNITAGTTSSGANLVAYASTYNANGMVRLFGTDGLNKVEFGASSATTAFLTTRAGVSMIFGANDAEQMRLTSTGLGIGTSSILQKLTVSGNAALAAASFPALKYYDNSSNLKAEIYYGVGGSDLNLVNYAAGPIIFKPNNTEAMRLDSAGNLGLGVTPSAWDSSYKAVRVNNFTLASQDQTGGGELSKNSYVASGGANTYIANGFATKYEQTAGTHKWFTAASGTAGNAISFTQAMTLTAGGDLGIGATSSLKKLTVQGSTADRTVEVIDNGSNDAAIMLQLSGVQEFTLGVDRTDNSFRIADSGALGTNDRLVIDSSGNLLVGHTSSFGKLSINSNGAPATSGNMSTGLTVSNGTGGTAINIGTYDAGSYNYIQSAYVNSAGTARALAFFTGATQAMTLDSSGNWLLGSTSSPGTIWSGDRTFAYVKGSAANKSGEVIVESNNGNQQASFFASGGSSEFGLWSTKASAILFGNNNTERARITSDGTLLIRSGAVPAINAYDAPFIFRVSGGGLGLGGSYETGGTSPIVFYTQGSERARIDSSGNLLLNTTSSRTGVNSISIEPSGNNYIEFRKSGSGSATQIQFNRNTDTTPTSAGSIATTGTTTSYNTSSDYRLKENIQPMTGALAKVAALKPCTYNWKADGSEGEGFIAHELAEVVPQCVTGEKDAVDEDGNPKYQGIDTSFLVATLTAAIQELKAEFDAYKATHP